MKRNIFKEFSWKRDGNGNYVVTCLETGKTLIAIPRLGKKELYCIQGSVETEINFYGQTIPKRYNKFEVMEYLSKQNRYEEVPPRKTTQP